SANYYGWKIWENEHRNLARRTEVLWLKSNIAPGRPATCSGLILHVALFDDVSPSPLRPTQQIQVRQQQKRYQDVGQGQNPQHSVSKHRRGVLQNQTIQNTKSSPRPRLSRRLQLLQQSLRFAEPRALAALQVSRQRGLLGQDALCPLAGFGASPLRSQEVCIVQICFR